MFVLYVVVALLVLLIGTDMILYSKAMRKPLYLAIFNKEPHPDTRRALERLPSIEIVVAEDYLMESKTFAMFSPKAEFFELRMPRYWAAISTAYGTFRSAYERRSGEWRLAESMGYPAPAPTCVSEPIIKILIEENIYPLCVLEDSLERRMSRDNGSVEGG